MRCLTRILAVSAMLLPTIASAWWNEDWSHRTLITLNTSGAGVETHEAVSAMPLVVRLHSGNFDFSAAKEDGADLRLVSGDDKTPLKFHVERFDAANELAVVWVQVPTVAPGVDKGVIYAYYGNAAAKPEGDATATYDGSYLGVFHFGEKDGVPTDARGGLKAAGTLPQETNGLLASSARFSGATMQIAANDRTHLAAGNPLSVSFWVRPDDVAKAALYAQGAVRIALEGGKLVASIGGAKLSGGDIPVAAWSHIALTLGGGKANLFVNGTSVAQGEATLPETGGDIAIGNGYTGQLDELQIAGAVRSADWVKLAGASQGADNKLVAFEQQTPDSASSGGSHSYMGILVGNLTTDAWVVIIILMVMFAIAAWVMVAKSIFVGKTDKDNRSFLGRFRNAKDDLLHLSEGAVHPNSSLFRLYKAGVRELDKRDVGKGGAQLSGASIDAVKAAIDADMVRETHRLNSHMVMLTIAISGGPFLGLLGTVVGVMITFAAIAAAGDVNVNAIAPGIAAALLATVAGLGVAIPSLFGYNYLASRIKNISSDMQIFVDEFVTRVAEIYGAR